MKTVNEANSSTQDSTYKRLLATDPLAVHRRQSGIFSTIFGGVSA
jgi:hypothetical protein